MDQDDEEVPARPDREGQRRIGAPPEPTPPPKYAGRLAWVLFGLLSLAVLIWAVRAW
jgi:hypothetical protein